MLEESGIPFATDAAARRRRQRAERLAHWRAPLNAGERAFAELLETEDLYVPAREIVYFSHWITAAGRPRRFNTRFFVARAPDAQSGAHDESETVHSFWVSPREALARHGRREIEVIFPTRTSLEDLGRFATSEAASNTRSLATSRTPRSGRSITKVRSAYSGARIRSIEIHWCDPGNRVKPCS
jgi:hypothetical protein